MEAKRNDITLRAILIGVVASGVFAAVNSYTENRLRMLLADTHVPALPYALLLAGVLLANPLMSLTGFTRKRRFSTVELLTVFMMCLVSSSLATNGLMSNLLPTVGGAYNEHWNNDQSRWNRYVAPYVDEAYVISEPGVQQAAREYRDAVDEYERLSRTLARARTVAEIESSIRRAQERITDAVELPEDHPDRDRELAVARQELEAVRRAEKQALAAWERLDDPRDPEALMEELPDKEAAAKERLDAKRAALKELEKRAFETVARFRRGLPDEMRALPGFVPDPRESASAYFARFRRLRCGMNASDELKAARDMLAAEGDIDAAAVAERLSMAAAALEPAAAAAEDERARLEELLVRQETLEERAVELEADLRRLNQERRIAPAFERKRIGGLITETEEEKARLEEERADVRLELEALRERLSLTDRTAAARDRIDELRARVEADGVPAPGAVAGAVDEIALSFNAFDGTLRRFVLGDVPWTVWLRPLGRWMALIILTYALMLTLNLLVFRQWAHNEMLTYPIAEFTEILGGAREQTEEATAEAEKTPPIYKRMSLWAGAGVVMFVEGWNIFVQTKLVQGLPLIKLKMFWPFYDSVFAVVHYDSKLEVWFTLAALSFLIPANISFSIWFFALVFMGQAVFMANILGYPAKSIHGADLLFNSNFRFAEGGGAMLVFAAVALWKCRKYFFCSIRPETVADLESGERSELRWSSAVFLACVAGLFLVFWLDLGAHPFYAALVLAVLVLMITGMTRAIAEGGMIHFKYYFGPFHVIRNLFGMAKSWCAPALWAPLVMYYTVFYLNIKPFIAPAMANCVRIRDDLRMSRVRWHAAVVLGMGAAMATAFAVHLVLAYGGGADAMFPGRYGGNSPLARSVFDYLATLSGEHAGPDMEVTGWFLGGAVVMGLLLVLRGFIFWLPHPLGLAMLVNPFTEFWFSIFLGWIVKHAVTKYGDRHAYVTARRFFVGIILGEIICYVIGTILAVLLDTRIVVEAHRWL